jgi:hypothetical protein
LASKTKDLAQAISAAPSPLDYITTGSRNDHRLDRASRNLHTTGSS